MLFSDTVEPLVKLVPFMVSGNVGPPAVTLVGVILVMVGGAVTVRDTALDAALPGFVTVTDKVPGCWIWLAGTEALSCVLLTKVVVSDVVPMSTVAPDTKLLPTTVKVNAGPPCVTVAGEISVMAGAGAVIVQKVNWRSTPFHPYSPR